MAASRLMLKDGQIRPPWPDGSAIHLRQRAHNLPDMIQIMHDPGRQKLVKLHCPELGVQPRPTMCIKLILNGRSCGIMEV